MRRRRGCWGWPLTAAPTHPCAPHACLPPRSASPLLALPPAALQLVEQFAEEAGVAFLPKPGRTHEGLQVRGPPGYLQGGGSCHPPQDGAAPLLWGRLPRPAPVRCLRLTLRSAPHSSCCRRPPPCAAQMYGFGLVSCVVDNANSVVKAQLGGSQGWATVSLEQLLGEHQKRAAAAGRK